MEVQAQRVLDLFAPKNPGFAGVIVADLGLNNGTQWVQVDCTHGRLAAVYLPALALEIPGNCFLQRASAGLLAVTYVVATNYQVPVRAGWGAGGWGDSPWG